MSFHSLENITPAAINKEKQPIKTDVRINKISILLIVLLVLGISWLLTPSKVNAAPLLILEYTKND